jgi:NAD(P)-dependent dehydrogenase (short-subunit alcohol dehydrogenase family)
MTQLDGRTAVITGAGSGIGAGIASELARHHVRMAADAALGRMEHNVEDLPPSK